MHAHQPCYMHARAPPCYMHTLPCNTQVRTFLEHAGLQHGEAALKEVRGFTGKLFENEEDYETPTVSVFFKDGGPYPYFLDHHKSLGKMRSKQYLKEPQVYVLTDHPILGIAPESL